MPITLAALCGVMCERSGVVNIGLEGIMLTAAFVGWMVARGGRRSHGPGDPSPFFGITLPLLIGSSRPRSRPACSYRCCTPGCRLSLRIDQIISGTIINIGAAGITGYMYSLVSGQSLVGAGQFQRLRGPPRESSNIPLVGWLINAVLNQGPDWADHHRHRDHPAGHAVPIALGPADPRLRRASAGRGDRRASTSSGCATGTSSPPAALAALGGVWLSMEQTGSFNAGMTQGRGFIGLAAMIVGRWTPLGAFGAALLFASVTGLSQSLTISQPTGDLGNLINHVPGRVLGSAALHHHDRRPGRPDRAKHRAGRRRSAIRARIGQPIRAGATTGLGSRGQAASRRRMWSWRHHASRDD